MSTLGQGIAKKKRSMACAGVRTPDFRAAEVGPRARLGQHAGDSSDGASDLVSSDLMASLQMHNQRVALAGVEAARNRLAAHKGGAAGGARSKSKLHSSSSASAVATPASKGSGAGPSFATATPIAAATPGAAATPVGAATPAPRSAAATPMSTSGAAPPESPISSLAKNWLTGHAGAGSTPSPCAGLSSPEGMVIATPTCEAMPSSAFKTGADGEVDSEPPRTISHLMEQTTPGPRPPLSASHCSSMRDDAMAESTTPASMLISPAIPSPPAPPLASLVALQAGDDVAAVRPGATIEAHPPAPTAVPSSDLNPPKFIPASATAASTASAAALDAPSAAVAVALPAEFFCPISHELMQDPVFTVDGETFERAAIERWLKRNTSNPLTGETLSEPTLYPNLPLANRIRKSGALAAARAVEASTASTAKPTAVTAVAAANAAAAAAAAAATSAPDAASGATAAATTASLAKPDPAKSAATERPSDLVPNHHAHRRRPAAVAAEASAGAPLKAASALSSDVAATRSTNPVIYVDLPSEGGNRAADGDADAETAAAPGARALTMEEKLQLWKQQGRPRVGKPSTSGLTAASPALAVTPAGALAAPQPLQPLQPRSERLNSQRTPLAAAPNAGPPAAARKPATKSGGAARALAASAAASTPAGDENQLDLAELLRSHNAKVRAKHKPAYEPRTQSCAAIKAWEKRTGRNFFKLSYQERWEAQQEIVAYNAQQQSEATAA